MKGDNPNEAKNLNNMGICSQLSSVMGWSIMYVSRFHCVGFNRIRCCQIMQRMRVSVRLLFEMCEKLIGHVEIYDEIEHFQHIFPCPTMKKHFIIGRQAPKNHNCIFRIKIYIIVYFSNRKMWNKWI